MTVNSRFAWDHGYYSPDIDITWSSFVGPGVKSRGIDGPSPADSPAVAAPDGGGLVPDFSTHGTWADETDIRPTMLFVAGLTDDYVMDGRVITQLFNGNGGAQADRGSRRLLQAAERERRSVRHVDPGGLDRGTGERLQVGRHEVRRHRRKAVDARIAT